MKSEIKKFGKTYNVPKPTEKEKSGLIQWGTNNLYGQFLNYMYYSCAIHQGIINGKVFFTISAGIKENPQGKVVMDLMKKNLKSIATSLEISDSYYILFRKDLATKTKIEHATFIPFEWVRVTVDGTFQVSENWSDNTCGITEYSNNPNDLHFLYQFKVEPMQHLIELSSKKVSENYYPIEPYRGATNAILSTIEISKYQLSEVINNFSLGTILSLNNGTTPLPEDKKELEDDIEEYSTGSENAGGVLVLYSNGKESEPTVLHLNGNQLHERYIALEKSIQDTIMKGHSVVSPSIFGFTTGGSFNQSDLDIGWWLMKENYFKVRQEQLLKVYDYIAKNLGLSIEFEFNEVKLPFATKQEEPTQQFSKIPTTDVVISSFSKVGRPRNEVQILETEPRIEGVEPFSQLFDKLNFNSAMELQVLSLIADENSFDKISKALNISGSDLAKIYQRLQRGGHLDEKGIITKQGKVEVIRNDIKKMEILYSYEVKDGYGREIIEGTRDFCKEMIRLDRLYTRQDIDSISSALGIDTWAYRGGWYHNPNTERNEPSCRHFWKSNLTYKK
jgi:CRISPR/Cas system CSM-associated protein Csm2 small subunit